jgi:hypothetical protein
MMNAPSTASKSSLWLRWVAGTLLIFAVALALAGAVVGAGHGWALVKLARTD